MSSARNANFLTSKWKVPSFFLFLPRWHPLSPFCHHQKAEQDAENLKNGPLWAARGSADTIKEWYRLQIMHVSSLILILCERIRAAQKYISNAGTLQSEERPRDHRPRTCTHQRGAECEMLSYNSTLKPFNSCLNSKDTTALLMLTAQRLYLWWDTMTALIKWIDREEFPSGWTTSLLVKLVSLEIKEGKKGRKSLSHQCRACLNFSSCCRHPFPSEG